ncbi:MAG: SAM-dependent chlorinase/fluorinase [Candidatus Eisenbacteria sp.]|nr:SAM-dependent chlorinase/fluorinase [Candidatus Eisenbacteria bacterium]
MTRRSGIITLTSDFGTRDAYVGAMKGVICSILPSARIVDITHEIRPQKVLEAAILLEAAYCWFPPGTVHVVVVDPGVGTKRRPLAVEADGQLFVGPDNGVLSAPLSGKRVRAHEITETSYELPYRSDTFHGRDVFAPAAGHLASGIEVDRLGADISGFVLLDLPKPVVKDDRIVGEILRTDRFGNAISNIPRSLLSRIGPGGYEVVASGQSFGKLRRRFQDVAEGESLPLTGGTGRIEIAVNGGSAAERWGLQAGDPIEIKPLSSDDRDA